MTRPISLTFLGTGTSTGVPQINCSCPVCTSSDPRDKRLRSSALLRVGQRTFLIDAGPDLRTQLLAHPPLTSTPFWSPTAITTTWAALMTSARSAIATARR